MPTRRFTNLDPAQQARVLRVAAEEFAEHGYDGASYNRIIERAGTSKGAMYYWFEDKADLYRSAVLDCLGRFVAHTGGVGPVVDAEGFWREVRALFGRGLAFYDVDPVAPGLIRAVARDALSGAGSLALGETRALTAGMYEQLVRLGQSVGAVRDDLPLDLILALLTSLSEGIDVWFAEHHAELSVAEREALVDRLVGMLRRMAVEER